MKIYIKNSISTVDPTFLLSKTDWENIIKSKKQSKTKYILLYFIHKNISMELHARFKTMFFSYLSSEENGTCEMDEAQIQFMEEVFLRFSFHF